MKRTSSCICGALAVLMLVAGAAAAEKPTVGVAEFTNSARAHWWYAGVGWDLADTLTNEMASLGSFTIVERAKLQPVLMEQDLAASGRIARGTGAKIGKLTGAKYLVMGSVSSYEENTKGGGGGIGFKGVRLGGKKSDAYIAVDLRVVDTNRRSPEDIAEPGKEVPVEGTEYSVADRSIVVLTSK